MIDHKWKIIFCIIFIYNKIHTQKQWLSSLTLTFFVIFSLFSVTKIKVILEILFVRELLAPFLAELYPEVKESIWILLSSTESNLTWS